MSMSKEQIVSYVENKLAEAGIEYMIADNEDDGGNEVQFYLAQDPRLESVEFIHLIEDMAETLRAETAVDVGFYSSEL